MYGATKDGLYGTNKRRIQTKYQQKLFWDVESKSTMMEESCPFPFVVKFMW